MKQLLAFFLVVVLTFSLVACQGQVEKSKNTSELSVETQKLEETAETTELEDIESESGKSEEQERNILIAYFTLGRNAAYMEDVDASTSASLVLDGEELVGTTEYVARLIQGNIGGDLHSIETVESYSTDFDTVVDQNHEEMNAGTLPELTESDLDIAQYDTVFIG